MVKRVNKILNYHHLHYDDTLFGDQKYVTEELLRNYAENDEYELQQIKDLWDSTDPEIRCWQNPIPLGIESFGINEGHDDGKEIYTFSDDTKFHGSTEFKNFNTIDKNKTTAHINTSEGKAELPVNTEEISNTETCNNGPWTGMKANEYWYISYNRTKTYTPNKYSDINSTEIPSVCRAQKFKAKETGYLKTLTLNLKGDKDAEYPLIIEIYKWETDSNLPIIKESNKLATSTYHFTVTSSALTSINFDSPPYLMKDSEYFFILRSPLTSYEHAYGVGGWSASCGEDTYPEGSCFLSENNGYSWIEHGKKDTKLKYHNGQNPPIDFAFTCHIEETRNTYPISNTPYTVYFKPLRMNPVRYVQITPRDNIPEGTSIDYWISQNGTDWKNINSGEIKFAEDTEEDKIKLYNNPNSTYLFLKAELSTTNQSLTPSISRILLTADTIPAHTAYLKSTCFTPRTGSMLNASIWSRCYHPYRITNTSNVNVKIDIYRNQINRDRIKIIKPGNIKNYKFTEEFIKEYYTTNKSNFVIDDEYLLQELTEYEANNIAEVKNENITGEQIQAIFNLNKYLDLTASDIEKLTILYNNELENLDNPEEFIEKYPLIINQLRKFNIFLEGVSQIPLSKPAIKYLKTVNFKGEDDNESISLLEDLDFKVDYDTGEDYNSESEIKLYKLEYNDKVYSIEDYGNTILQFNGDYYNLTAGDLEIEYNPLYIKGLTMNAFYKYDANGDEILDSTGVNICDGFPLDIMIDTFIPYNKSSMENDLEFNLSVDPVCALRKVLINEGTDNERELIEDVDFTVDYENKRLKLFNDIFTNDTDYLTVRYTPNLTDTSLGVAYRMYRENDTDQAYILPNYWQYRI